MKLIANISRAEITNTELWFFYTKRTNSLIKKIRNWLYRYRLHMLIWALFIAYELVLVIAVYGVYSSPLTYVAHYTIIVCLFYFHAYLGLPWATSSRSAAYLKVPLLIIAEIAAYIVIGFGIDLLLAKAQMILAISVDVSYLYFFRNLYRALYFLGFASGYYYLRTYNREKQKSEELEKQRLNAIIQLSKAQNAFLKAQINPHFLFNTLDFIYHNVNDTSPVAADAIITLSEMMRFAIDADKMGEFITLGDELEQVTNLVHLSQLRKDEAPDFRISYEDDITGLRFIPLVLLTLAENIFKHGDLNKGQYATFTVFMKLGILYIETDNQSTRREQEGDNRTGLANIEKRLKHAYGEQVSLTRYQDPAGRFKVSVQVPLHLLS